MIDIFPYHAAWVIICVCVAFSFYVTGFGSGQKHERKERNSVGKLGRQTEQGDG